MMKHVQKLSVSIVIPNYNGSSLLENNIPHVLSAMASYGGLSELIVVDDASQDDSLELMGRLFPQIKIITHQKNQGFSEAIKSGVVNSQYDYVLLLNSDVIPEHDFIAPLMEWFEDDNVFSVSPLILDQNQQVLSYSKNLRRFKKGKLKALKWDMNNLSDQKIAKTEEHHLFSSGGSAVVKKSYFASLGCFADIFKPFYFEDTDLGVRAWRHGWKTIFDPRSKIVHPTGSTINSYNKPWRVKMVFHRNYILLHWIHLSPINVWSKQVPWLILRMLLDVIRFDWVKVASIFVALTKLSKVLEMRRDLKKDSVESFESVLDKLNRSNK